MSELMGELGKVDEARTNALQAVAVTRGLHDRISTLFTMAALALALHRGGDDELAGVVWGAIEAEVAAGAAGRFAPDQQYYADRLGEPNDAFARGRARGSGLTLDEAAALAGVAC
jgi:hypothetical protein